MSAAHASSLGIVAYLALFATVGLAFLFVSLLIGRFFRPSPSPIPLFLLAGAIIWCIWAVRPTRTTQGTRAAP